MKLLMGVAGAAVAVLAGFGGWSLWLLKGSPDDIDRLARELGVGAGAVVADVGAGSGSWAVRLAGDRRTGWSCVCHRVARPSRRSPRARPFGGRRHTRRRRGRAHRDGARPRLLRCDRHARRLPPLRRRCGDEPTAARGFAACRTAGDRGLRTRRSVAMALLVPRPLTWRTAGPRRAPCRDRSRCGGRGRARRAAGRGLVGWISPDRRREARVSRPEGCGWCQAGARRIGSNPREGGPVEGGDDA